MVSLVDQSHAGLNYKDEILVSDYHHFLIICNAGCKLWKHPRNPKRFTIDRIHSAVRIVTNESVRVAILIKNVKIGSVTPQ